MEFVCYNQRIGMYLMKCGKKSWAKTPHEGFATKYTCVKHFDAGKQKVCKGEPGWDVIPYEKKKPTIVINARESNFALTSSAISMKNAISPFDLDEEVAELISRYKDISHGIPDPYVGIEEQRAILSDIDRRLVDVGHYIEWIKADACTGYKIFSMQQKLYKRRRVVKDKIAVYEYMLSSPGIDIYSGKAIERVEQNLKDRYYNPREVKEFFEMREVNQ